MVPQSTSCSFLDAGKIKATKLGVFFCFSTFVCRDGFETELEIPNLDGYFQKQVAHGQNYVYFA